MFTERHPQKHFIPDIFLVPQSLVSFDPKGGLLLSSVRLKGLNYLQHKPFSFAKLAFHMNDFPSQEVVPILRTVTNPASYRDEARFLRKLLSKNTKPSIYLESLL